MKQRLVRRWCCSRVFKQEGRWILGSPPVGKQSRIWSDSRFVLQTGRALIQNALQTQHLFRNSCTFITLSTLKLLLSVVRSSRPPNSLNLTLNSVRIGGFDKEKQNRVNLLCSTLVWPAQVVNIKHIHYKIQLFPSFRPLKGTREQEKEQNSLLPACVFVLTIRFSWLWEMFIGKKKTAPVRIRRDPSLLIFRTEDETGFSDSQTS